MYPDGAPIGLPKTAYHVGYRAPGSLSAPAREISLRAKTVVDSERKVNSTSTTPPTTPPLAPPTLSQSPYLYNMADAAPRGRGGFGSRGDRGGDRGRGRGRRGRRGGAKEQEKEWQPVTKLGRLVKAGKITSMEQIYLHSLPVKEYQIVDFFLPKLKDEVMKVRSERSTKITRNIDVENFRIGACARKWTRNWIGCGIGNWTMSNGNCCGMVRC